MKDRTSFGFISSFIRALRNAGPDPPTIYGSIETGFRNLESERSRLSGLPALFPPAGGYSRATDTSDLPSFPTLDTPRLRLRALTEADAPAYRALLHLPEVTRFTNAVRFNYFIKPWRCGGIGYEAHPAFWGHGLMSEMVRAVAKCGHGRFDLHRIEAWTVPEKAGFRLEGVQRQRGRFNDAFHDWRLFGRLASDPL
jgi:ribosomal-protein-alanine N-acetyltransferase